MNSPCPDQAVWNLPVSSFPDRAATYWDIVAGGMPCSASLDILEIGVFRAALLRGLSGRNDIQIKSYTGVDPYLGIAGDAYLGSYWKGRTEADVVWKGASDVFRQAGGNLVRQKSHEFYGASGTREWDVIIVDGDHRLAPALWDLHHWFKRVRPGGMLLADDYGNSDAPEVTSAVNEFIRENRTNVSRSGYRLLPFQNKGKEVPISLTIVYFQKAMAPVETRSWPYRAPDNPVVRGLRRALHRLQGRG